MSGIEANRLKCFTILENSITNDSNVCGNNDRGQTGAIHEGIFFNLFNCIWNVDLRQNCTIFECTSANGLEFDRQVNVPQIPAI
jgi:hypothetical protein